MDCGRKNAARAAWLLLERRAEGFASPENQEKLRNGMEALEKVSQALDDPALSSARYDAGGFETIYEKLVDVINEQGEGMREFASIVGEVQISDVDQARCDELRQDVPAKLVKLFETLMALKEGWMYKCAEECFSTRDDVIKQDQDVAGAGDEASDLNWAEEGLSILEEFMRVVSALVPGNNMIQNAYSRAKLINEALELRKLMAKTCKPTAQLDSHFQACQALYSNEKTLSQGTGKAEIFTGGGAILGALPFTATAMEQLANISIAAVVEKILVQIFTCADFGPRDVSLAEEYIQSLPPAAASLLAGAKAFRAVKNTAAKIKENKFDSGFVEAARVLSQTHGAPQPFKAIPDFASSEACVKTLFENDFRQAYERIDPTKADEFLKKFAHVNDAVDAWEFSHDSAWLRNTKMCPGVKASTEAVTELIDSFPIKVSPFESIQKIDLIFASPEFHSRLQELLSTKLPAFTEKVESCALLFGKFCSVTVS